MKTHDSSAELIPIATDGRRLALVRAGSGAPPMVFETGLGAESAEWESIFDAVSHWTTVCRYDRANRGASDSATKPRTVGDLTADLHALLIATEIPRPVILVGHSLGGWIARRMAQQCPDEVAGLVLVDPMHPDQFERTGPLFFSPVPGEPPSRTQMRRFWTTDWRDPSRNAEGVDFPASQREDRAFDSLGAIPLIVLTAGAYLQDSPTDPVGQAQAARLQAEWDSMHCEILRQSSRSQHRTVETCGHFVQRERPDLIVAAVRDMLESVRNETSGRSVRL